MSGRKPWLLEEMTLGDVQKFGAERIHLRGQHAQLAREPVVHDDGGDRGREPDGGGDQRLGDARRDGLDTRRRGGGEAAERRHDPPDRAEETDERRRARGGGEERDPQQPTENASRMSRTARTTGPEPTTMSNTVSCRPGNVSASWASTPPAKATLVENSGIIVSGVPYQRPRPPPTARRYSTVQRQSNPRCWYAPLLDRWRVK